MVAGTFAETGELREARKLFDRSLGLARRIGDRRTLVTALNNSGWAALRDHDLTTARETLEEALELATELGHQSSRLSALSLLGAEANLANDRPRARRYLDQALTLGRDSGRPIYLLEALTEYAIALEDAETERATHLVAAADAGYSERGIVRPPVEEQRVETLRAYLRNKLGDDRYERSYAYGSSISLAAAIDDALTGNAVAA
jgi:tetratricopeptide (TPR) repeat protein